MWIQCTFPNKIVLEPWIFYIFRLEKDDISCAWEFDITRCNENSTLTLFSKQGDINYRTLFLFHPTRLSLSFLFAFSASFYPVSFPGCHLHLTSRWYDPNTNPEFPLNQTARIVYQNAKGDYELFKMAKKKTGLPHLLEIKVFTFTIPFTDFNISDAI